MDFVHDQLATGYKLRVLTIIDAFTRFSPALAARFRVTRHCVFPPDGVRVGPQKDGQMTRARFTEEQIIAVLKEHEAGAKTDDLARQHGISEATIYNWKAKFDGMDVSEAKRLNGQEEENAKLKKLLAEQMLDAAALRELLSKEWLGQFSGSSRRAKSSSRLSSPARTAASSASSSASCAAVPPSNPSSDT